MKRFCIVVAVLAVTLLAGAVGPAYAFFDFYFGENGVAAYDLRDGAGKHTVAGYMAPDPWLLVNTLHYDLPLHVTTGDIRVWEDAGMTAISDLLRFTNAANDLSGAVVGTMMIFYSLKDGGDLADTGLPLKFELNEGGAPAIENAAGSFVWDVVPPGLNNVYYGESPVPIPSALLLFAPALGGLVALRRRLGR